MSEAESIPFHIAYLNEKADQIISIARMMETPCFIGIDGRCASGKTTLGGICAAKSGWPLVHLDDFFLRPEQRTEERYQTPGENVDWERLLEEVILPLEAGKDAVFRKFDCSVMNLGETVVIPYNDHVIFEGSYAFHQNLRDHFRLKVFMDVEPDAQLERILERNGAEKLERFKNEWIPLEEKYFVTCNVRDAADLYINTSMQDDF